MTKLAELRSSRVQLLEQARALVERAEAEGRDLTAEEAAQYDRLLDDVAALDSRIERLRTVEAIRAGSAADDAEPVRSAMVGMSQSEVQRYSLVRAIRAAASGDWRDAALEREASEAVARALGREPRTFFVPADVLRGGRESRDLLAGVPAQGGYMVGTDTLPVIDLLRSRLVVAQAGATVLSDLRGNVAIPRMEGGATAAWVAEGTAPAESTPSFGQLQLVPKSVAGYVDISRRLLMQASEDVERLVREDLAATIARAIDRAALHGSGSGPEPRGIANTTGVAVVPIGADGGPVAWSHIVALETEVAVDNADLGSLAYVTNPKVRGALKATEKATGTAQYIWGDGPMPLNGYRAFVTTLVRSDLTKGAGTNLSAIFFGNWADLIVAQWAGLDVLVDPYTGGASGTVRVVAYQDVDIGVRHPESFSVILDAQV